MAATKKTLPPCSRDTRHISLAECDCAADFCWMFHRCAEQAHFDLSYHCTDSLVSVVFPGAELYYMLFSQQKAEFHLKYT